MFFKKSHEIVIDYYDIIRLIRNDTYYFFWIEEYEKYIKKAKKNTIYENIEIQNLNKYYIDTWLSKIILEVLKSYTDKFNSIKYVNCKECENVTFDVTDYPNFFCFSLTQKNVTSKIIELNSDIKDISIDDLNTFSTINTENKLDGPGSRGNYTTFTTIRFPKKLKFELTLNTGKFFYNSYIQNLQIKINEEIIKKFNSNIQDLNEHYLNLKNNIINMIEEREIDTKEKEIIIKKGKERQNLNKIKIIYYLNSYKFNENNLENNLNWENFVNYNLSKIDFLNHITKIIDELKKCKGQTDEEDVGQMGGRTNKKRPKKEILGKIMVIYKINGDRKEYVRHKGKLITIKDYKELMKAKKAKKLTLNSKKK